MATLGRGRWIELSGYVDQLFDLPDAARPAWLDALAGEQPAIADALRALLDEHRALERDRFMEDGPVRPDRLPSLAGQSFGAYTLVTPIGQGGMGTVWRAERNDGRFHRDAAIKLLHPAVLGRRSEERFTREGRIL